MAAYKISYTAVKEHGVRGLTCNHLALHEHLHLDMFTSFKSILVLMLYFRYLC